jgi:hypothetical protein
VLVNEPTNGLVRFHHLEDEPTTDRFNPLDYETNLQSDQFSLASMLSHEHLFKT